MADAAPPRVQFLVSGKFIALLLIAAGLLGGGYYWYNRQQQVQKRFTAPPYFVSIGQTVIRSCKNCLEFGLGKLKPQPDWKVGPAKQFTDTEQRWFLAVEDPPMPVTVAGVLMLPVHPTLVDNNPTLGFDQASVLLVLYQALIRKAAIEQPPPPPQLVTLPKLTVDSDLKIQRTGFTSWRVEVPSNGQWYNTGIPVIALQKLSIKPTEQKNYVDGEGQWRMRLDDYEDDVLKQDYPAPRELSLTLSEDWGFVTGPDWVSALSLCVYQHTAAAFSMDVDLEFADPTSGHTRKDALPWEQHVQRHQQARLQIEELLKKP